MDMNGILLLDVQRRVFSVYETKNSLVIRDGCEDVENTRLISTHRSYETAREFAEVVSEVSNLPLIDLTNPCTSFIT
jgi:hypothetical protein